MSELLLGPFPIERARLLVTPRPGVYVLYPGYQGLPGRPAYVGRSDTDLRSRILASAVEHPGICWFCFKAARSSVEAFYLECRYYHELQPTDNRAHPDPPPFTHAACPVCTRQELQKVLHRMINPPGLSPPTNLVQLLQRLSQGGIR